MRSVINTLSRSFDPTNVNLKKPKVRDGWDFPVVFTLFQGFISILGCNGMMNNGCQKNLNTNANNSRLYVDSH